MTSEQMNNTQTPDTKIPEDALIMVAVRDLVLFPGAIGPIAIARPKSIAAAQQALREQQIGKIDFFDLAEHFACGAHDSPGQSMVSSGARASARSPRSLRARFFGNVCSVASRAERTASPYLVLDKLCRIVKNGEIGRAPPVDAGNV